MSKGAKMLAIPELTKQCSKCGERKPHSDFHRRSLKVGGVRSDCKRCANEANAIRRKGKREKNLCQVCGHDPVTLGLSTCESCQKRQRVYGIRRYNLTPHEYESLFEAQGHKCAICQRDPAKVKGSRRCKDGSVTAAHIDHCHNCRAIRGILCAECNRALGGFGEDGNRLRAAAAYVDAHGQRYYTRVNHKEPASEHLRNCLQIIQCVTDLEQIKDEINKEKLETLARMRDRAQAALEVIEQVKDSLKDSNTMTQNGKSVAIARVKEWL